MSARSFWCQEGRHWIDVPKDQTTNERRRKHAEEHKAERSVFASLDLMELDAQLDGFYGGAL
jgi:hypothetical protein